jgi:EAL domain-containing protein (putative c-di-GMP-specific phosphodiesterase class I)
MVESILEEGARPQDLVLELTESAFIEDPAMTGTVIESARSEGFRIFLDDFGTGYSSIGYLKDYHFDAIKIDRQFVAGIGKDRRVARLLEVFTELAGVFDLGIIIEGVEEKDQLELLVGIHVDAVQGDYFSTPVDAESAAVWIESMPVLPQGRKLQRP